jgi:hypothetical protein
MANLINAMTNDKLNPLNGNSVSLKDVGKLTKIVSEIKLIEGFQPIKVTASRDIFINQKPAQLLEARTIENKNFSLIIENKNTPIEGIKQVGLDMDSKKNSFTLSFIESHKNKEKAIDNNTKPIYNNNLNPTDLNRNKIDKHYSGAVNQASSQSSRSQPNIEQNRTELQVRLASKIEYLSVLAKLPSQESSNLKPLDSKISSDSQAQVEKQTTRNQTKIITPSILMNTSHTKDQTGNIKEQIALPQTRSVDNKSISPQASSKSIPSAVNEAQDKTTISDKRQATLQQEPKTELRINTQSQSGILSTQDSRNLNNAANSPTHLGPSFNQARSLIEPSTHSKTQATQNHITSALEQAPLTHYRVSKDSNEFILASKTPLNIGEKIQVITDSQGNIQLLPKQKEVRENTLNSAFAKSLPQQITKHELVQLIQSLNRIQGSAQLNESSQKLIQQLLSSIPQRQELESPQSVKQAIYNSGLFLENKLLNNPSNLTQDIKANWLNIQTAASQHSSDGNTPQTAIKEGLDVKANEAISQAVERITSSQIRNLLEPNRLEGLTLPLNIELPIQDKDSTSIFQLQIDQDQSDSSKPEKKKKWLAKLLFDFPETGKFEARLNVEENKVAVIFVAEDKDTENKIRQRRDILAKQLEDKGLEVSKLESFSKPIDKNINTTQKHSLIDVRT